MKKAALVALTASLFVSPWPGTAFAGGAQLQAGTVAVSNQSVKPKAPNAAPKSLYSLYKSVLKKAVRGSGEYASVHNTRYSYSPIQSSWRVSYCVYDINADGMPELLVSAGYSLGDTRWYAYTTAKGKVKFLGTVSGGHFWLSASSVKKGFLCSSAMHTGYSIVNRITVAKGDIREKRVAYDGPYADMTGAPNSTKYFKKHKLKALAVSAATKYSLLEKKAKITSKKIYDASVSVQKSATYTGKALKPKVKVKYLGKALKAGKDYSVSYRNAKGKKVSAPKAIGAYKVTVKGKGAYRGSQTATFTVKKRTPVIVRTTGAKVTLPGYWRGKVTVSKSSYASRAYVTVRDKKGALVMQVQCAPKRSFSIDGQMGTRTVGKKSGARYTAAVIWDSFGATARYDSTVKLQSGGKVGSLAAANANRDAWIAKTNAYLKKAVLEKMKVG